MRDLDLQSWAKNSRIWELDSWRPYFDQLLNVYNQALRFKGFHTWLKETFDGRSIVDLPEDFRNSARMCISGGGSEKNAFGRLMFEKFGLGVVNCNSYEQSLEEYERCGDWVEMSVRDVVLGWERYDEEFLSLLSDVINHFAGVLNVEVEEPEMEDDFTKWVEYPNPKLIEELESFLNALAGMLEFTNYYTMIMRYFFLAPLPMIARFLDVGIDEIKKLAKLWKIEFVYDSNLNRIDVRDIERSKAYELFWICIDENCLPYKILRIFGYNGLAHKLIGEFALILDVYLNIEFQRLWSDRLEALKKFKESGGWSLDKNIKDFIINVLTSEVLEFTVLFQNGLINQVKYLVVNRVPSYDPTTDRVIYNSTSTVTARNLLLDGISINRFLYQIFPLTATGFLEPIEIGDNAITFRFNDVPNLDRLGVLFL